MAIYEGTEGNDILRGAVGADTLIGRGGNDIYVVNHARDVIVERAGGGIDLVRSAVGYALAADVENLVLTGTLAINGTGNALANNLAGNNAANRLDGGGGADRMEGGRGNDIYIIDHAGDRVVESSGQGADTVRASIDHVLGANVENLSLTGGAAIDGTGNGGRNTIVGNGAANVLNGGAGIDRLVGGAGADRFVFDSRPDAGNLDTIADFASNDIIALNRKIFDGLDANGPLGAGAFRLGGRALDADDRIVYDRAAGKLFYDADGNGAGAAVQLAQLRPGTALGRGDIAVYFEDRAPELRKPIADQTTNAGELWTFRVPVGAFGDLDGDALTFRAARADGSALPGWLSFDAATRTFTGTPPAGWPGSIDLKVIASDGNRAVADTFTLEEVSEFHFSLAGKSWGVDSIGYTFDDYYWEFEETFDESLSETVIVAGFNGYIRGAAGIKLDFRMQSSDFAGEIDYDVTERVSRLEEVINTKPFVTIGSEIVGAADFGIIGADPAGNYAQLFIGAEIDMGLGGYLGVDIDVIDESFDWGFGTGPLGFGIRERVTAEDSYTLDTPYGSLTVAIPGPVNSSGGYSMSVGAYGGTAITATALSDPFLSGTIDLSAILAELIGLLPPPASAAQYLFEEHEVTLISVAEIVKAGVTFQAIDLALNGNVSLKETVTVDPRMMVTARSSFGETLTGVSGETLQFTTPEGEGFFTADMTYRSQAVVTTVIAAHFQATFDAAFMELTIWQRNPIPGIPNTDDRFVAYDYGTELFGVDIPIRTVTQVFDMPGVERDTVRIAYEKFRTVAGSGDNFTFTTHQTFAIGNNRANALTGNRIDNRIVGNGGDDRLIGLQGDDLLTGGLGLDMLSGGDGNDVIDGGAGIDILTGGAGSDIIRFGDGNERIGDDRGSDSIDGGGGDDILTDRIGDNDLFGGEGDDRLTSGAGGDLIEGGAGDDVMIAGEGLNILHGGSGDDRIDSGDGADFVTGGDDDDLIVVGSGDNDVQGGDGHDRITALAGDDDIGGGAGDDIIAAGAGTNFVTGGAGNDEITTGGGNDEIGGGGGDDLVVAGGGRNRITGDAGADVIRAGNEANDVDGGAGDDRIAVGSAGDRLTGGLGNDVIIAGAGANRIDAGSGNDSVVAGDGADRVTGGDGDDSIVAANGANILDGGEGDDRISAGGGIDIVTGGEGDDRIETFAGSDRITGGAGRDYIDAGAGNEILVGDVDPADAGFFDLFRDLAGAHADIFVFGRGSGRDTILDFNLRQFEVGGVTQVVEDRIDLSDFTQYRSFADLGVEEILVDGKRAYRIAPTATDILILYTNVLNVFDDRSFIFATSGRDVFRGTSGRDLLDGGADADRLIGLGGNDTYRVDNVGDVIVEAEGEGNDTALVYGDFVLSAGAHVETIRALYQEQAVNITGNELGNDITGNEATNILSGAGGDDIIHGGNVIYLQLARGDTLNGGGGDDQLHGGRAGDRFNGGAGLDTVVYSETARVDLVDPGANSGQAIGDSFTGIERFVFGGGHDQAIGDGTANRFEGNNGQDVLNGGGGSDVLIGGDDYDRLIGGDGNDVMTGDGGDGAGFQGDDFEFAVPGRLGTIDRILDFTSGSDRIVLRGPDALSLQFDTDGILGAFEIGAVQEGNAIRVSVNFDADEAVELTILLIGAAGIAQSDFLLIDRLDGI
ncbi:putative Ig domain-containing protein [Enterovirga sp. GCM10030262]|uniref:putative Ig domain-containing protein n=1 Tax=Enterovirga sp. GCM10030262 TaxID=3273391 RepID=UPI00360FB3BC